MENKITSELPKKDRPSFYTLLILATATIIGLIFWVFSLSGDCGQDAGCGIAMAIFFLITLGYILVIGIVIAVGYENNILRTKLFRIILFLVILTLPLFMGSMFLKDFLDNKNFNKTKNKITERNIIANKYLSEGDLKGCIDYVSKNKFRDETYLYRDKDVQLFCEHKLGYIESKLIENTKNINLCTMDFCYYKYALVWRDVAACYKIKETTVDYYHSSWSTLFKDKCVEELNDKLITP